MDHSLELIQVYENQPLREGSIYCLLKQTIQFFLHSSLKRNRNYCFQNLTENVSRPFFAFLLIVYLQLTLFYLQWRVYFLPPVPSSSPLNACLQPVDIDCVHTVPELVPAYAQPYASYSQVVPC